MKKQNRLLGLAALYPTHADSAPERRRGRSGWLARAVIVVLFCLLTGMLPGRAGAVCRSMIVNPVTVNWDIMFPMTVAGARIGDDHAGIIDPPGPENKAICRCPTGLPPPLHYRYGFSFAFFNPNRVVESVKDPFCFPSLGVGFPGVKLTLQGEKRSRKTKGTEAVSAQVHYVGFPAAALLGTITAGCFKPTSDLSVLYLSEVDPLWNDSTLAVLINPEVLVFSNLAAVMACSVDSVSSNAGLSLSFMPWCMGSWGVSYPLNKYSNNPDYVEANMHLSARMIYKLGRQGMLWDHASYLCFPLPMPFMIKHYFRFQMLRPNKRNWLFPVGRSALAWSAGGNTPVMGDNFAFLVSKKYACCMF